MPFPSSARQNPLGTEAIRAIELLELQPEGKKRIPARDFVHGNRPQTEESLGQ